MHSVPWCAAPPQQIEYSNMPRRRNAISMERRQQQSLPAGTAAAVQHGQQIVAWTAAAQQQYSAGAPPGLSSNQRQVVCAAAVNGWYQLPRRRRAAAARAAAAAAPSTTPPHRCRCVSVGQRQHSWCTAVSSAMPPCRQQRRRRRVGYKFDKFMQYGYATNLQVPRHSSAKSAECGAKSGQLDSKYRCQCRYAANAIWNNCKFAAATAQHQNMRYNAGVQLCRRARSVGMSLRLDSGGVGSCQLRRRRQQLELG